MSFNKMRFTAEAVSLLVESAFSTSQSESSFTSGFLHGADTSLTFLDFDFWLPFSHLGHRTLKKKQALQLKRAELKYFIHDLENDYSFYLEERMGWVP